MASRDTDWSGLLAQDLISWNQPAITAATIYPATLQSEPCSEQRWAPRPHWPGQGPQLSPGPAAGRGGRRECRQTVTNYLEQESPMLLTDTISRQISSSFVTDSCSFSHHPTHHKMSDHIPLWLDITAMSSRTQVTERCVRSSLVAKPRDRCCSRGLLSTPRQSAGGSW